MEQCQVCGRPREEQGPCPHCGASGIETDSPVKEIIPVDSGPEHSCENQEIPPEPKKASKKQKALIFVPLLILVLLVGIGIWVFDYHSVEKTTTAEKTVDTFLHALSRQDANELLSVVTCADASMVLNEQNIAPYMETFQNAGDLSLLKSKLLSGESNNGAKLIQSGKKDFIELTPIPVNLTLDFQDVALAEEQTCTVTIAGMEYPVALKDPLLTLRILPGYYPVQVEYETSDGRSVHCSMGSGFYGDSANVADRKSVV